MFNCPDLSGCKRFTICFWAKIEDDANITVNWQDIIGFTTQTADNSNTGQLRSESYYANTTATSNIRYIHWHDNTTYAFSDFTVYHTANGDTQRNVWHHCVLAMDSENGIWAYTDGNPITVSGGTVMNGGHLTGQFWLGETNNIQGVINDVRVYKDEILSPKMIKEISKGLVCHYTLSGGGGDNLFKGNYSVTTTSAGNTVTGENNDMPDAANLLKVNSGKTLWFSFDYSVEGSKAYTSSDEYTKYRYGAHLSLNYTNTSGTTKQAYPCTEYLGMVGTGRAIQSFKIPVDIQTVNSFGVVIQPFNKPASGNTATWYLRNFKIEIGDKPTPWVPHTTDIAYAAMGFDDGIEYDVSGYKYNGTKIGTITYDVDTPRYWTSSYFNGGNNAITVPFNTIIPASTTPFTVNLWFKKTELGTDAYESLFGGPGGFEMDTRSGNSTTLSLYMASTRGGHIYSPFNLNEWYMVTMASDRTNEYYYVNGELVNTIEAKTMPVGDYFIGAWQVYSKQNIKGYISDFRIYATALSAEDVQQLYNTPISLSSNGTLMTQGEFTEV